MITGGVNMGPWMGDDATRKIVAEMNRRVYAAAVMVRNHAKQLINREGAMRLFDLMDMVGNMSDADATAFRRQFNRNRANTSVLGEATRVRMRASGAFIVGGRASGNG